MLPRISLTAGGSSVSSELIVLKDTSNPIWSFGANLIAPLYQGGALRAQVEIRIGRAEAGGRRVRASGQRAFGEVENALAAEIALRDRDVILEATVRDSARALELAQIQYRVGSVDLRAVEQNQLALYSARIALLRVQTRTAGAARQPVPCARGRLRPAPAGDGTRGGAVMQEVELRRRSAIACSAVDPQMIRWR